MPAVLETPVRLVETLAELRFQGRLDARLQDLMDRNNDALLAPAEREELAELVELSETISLLRGQALRLLGRTP